MDSQIRVVLQEVTRAIDVVMADIAAYDVELVDCGLRRVDSFEEGDEPLAGLTAHDLSEDLAGPCIRYCKQARCACPSVLEAEGLGAPGRQRQHQILAIEQLDRGHLVDPEHRHVSARVRLQPYQIGGFRLLRFGPVEVASGPSVRRGYRAFAGCTARSWRQYRPNPRRVCACSSGRSRRAVDAEACR